MTEADLLPLPEAFREYRDKLRVVGYELVRYTSAHAGAQASKYRHQSLDYEYGIHKIECIQSLDGQIFIADSPFYASADSVPNWVSYYVEKERPEGLSLIKRWFSDPAYALLTLAVPPYGLTMLGLAAAGDRMSRKEQRERARSLPRLSDMPKFLKRRGA